MKNNVVEYLIDTAKKFPDKIAFECLNSSVTFFEFDKTAKNISTNLLNITEILREPVGIFLPKSIDAITAFIGVLYSGNIYMPLDIKSPKDRLNGILNNIKPPVVITDNANLEKLKDSDYKGKIILYEELIEDCAEIKTGFEKIIDTDGAYILNTSGSTGVPKGVLIPHRAIIDFIEWSSNYFDVSEKEIIANQAPLYFDLSVLDIYTTLKNGCKLVLVPDTFFVFPVKLLEYLQQKQVNMFLFVPSVLVNIANLDLLKTLRPRFDKILFCGEVMPTKQLNYWIKYYPDTMFCNLYGPTEATVACTYYTVNRKFSDNEPLPIGVGCNNTDILILNEDNKLITAPNISGELCVRGNSLALGYYNDFEKTSKAFTQNPLNDKYPEKIYRTGDIVHYNNLTEIMFEGRKDFQIKHLGYRIELGEIETALGAIAELKKVCVVYDSQNSKIVLFYESDSVLQQKDLIKGISNSIPKYMIPTEMYRLDKLPVNSNGKTDRIELNRMLKEGELGNC